MARDPDCIFCKIVAGELPATVIAEDDHTVAFMDISPATRGHSLVVPREHAEDLLSIEAEELAAVMHAAQKVAARSKEVLDADGINLINSCGAAAWQTVFHFHVHVVPRYDDDPLKLPWVPEEGDADEIRKVGEELRA
jgi:histidine triad (HIT) family protein